LIASTYSGSSLAGLVSSKRRLHGRRTRGDAEVQADRLGVADVQVAVGFGREAGADGGMLAAGEVVAHDLADEILLAGRRGVRGIALGGGGVGGRWGGRGVVHGARIGGKTTSLAAAGKPVPAPARRPFPYARASARRATSSLASMRVIYEAENVIDAHLVKGMLEAEEIPAYVRGEHLTGGIGELPVMGLVAVCVADVDLAAAERVIAVWRSEPERAPDGRWDAEPDPAY
jgi:hypothetical protein